MREFARSAMFDRVDLRRKFRFRQPAFGRVGIESFKVLGACDIVKFKHGVFPRLFKGPLFVLVRPAAVELGNPNAAGVLCSRWKIFGIRVRQWFGGIPRDSLPQVLARELSRRPLLQDGGLFSILRHGGAVLKHLTDLLLAVLKVRRSKRRLRPSLEVCGRIIRIEPHGRLQIGDAPPRVSACNPRYAAFFIVERLVRLQLDSCIEITYRLVQVALPGVGVAPAVIDPSIFRVQADGL